MWVHALADSDAACGGKATGLARLLAAGLAVPDGFAIDARAFAAVVGELPADRDALGHALAAAAERIATAAIDPELEREVRARAAPLGTLAVRSSATIEDGAGGAAAGVFASVVPAEGSGGSAREHVDVWAAIRAVWASALTPLAVAYARGHRLAMGVIVQRHVAGERATIYTRSPGDPETAVVQRGDRLERVRRDDPAIADALRAEAAIGAAATGADVELIFAPPDAWIVQARPIVQRARELRVPPPDSVLASLRDGREWRWDVAHNPDPLSPAQAGLVERIERAAIAPWSLRVCAGFLYASGHTPKIVVTDVAARAAVLEARLAAALGDDQPNLEIALARYEAFYRIWACELAPLIAGGRAQGAPAAGARPSAIEATLGAAARGELDEAAVIERLGALAPAWDVAVPTFGERPQLLRDAITRARSVVANRSPHAAPATVDLAADLAERDDAWFARAQLLVRRALLARGDELGIGDDVFWLPLEDVLGTTDRDALHRRASAARAAAARAARWAMPLVVGGPPPIEGPALHGVGSGPRVTGRVVRFATLGSAVAVATGDIVVTRAVTPALAVLVVGCAAIVSETGGLLDHGAALARELGIPCVVGCRDAWTLLVDGQHVTVDGDRGVVTTMT